MADYLLNSAVITSPGVYSYQHITPQEARRFVEAGTFVSTIGYAETAAALSELLNISVEVNPVTIKMEPGDRAIVFRLVLPAGTPRIAPKDKGRIKEVIHNGHWELGLLIRLS